MKTYASMEERNAIEAEALWQDRDLPKTIWGMLTRTATAHPSNKAISYQLTSGPTDPVETLTWDEMRRKVAQTANFFRSLGVGPTDKVAYLLPNANETVLTYFGGMVAAGLASTLVSTTDFSAAGVSVGADLVSTFSAVT